MTDMEGERQIELLVLRCVRGPAGRRDRLDSESLQGAATPDLVPRGSTCRPGFCAKARTCRPGQPTCLAENEAGKVKLTYRGAVAGLSR